MRAFLLRVYGGRKLDPNVPAQHEASEALRRRALGWAVSFGTALLDNGLTDAPLHAEMGRAILRRVSGDARGGALLDETGGSCYGPPPPAGTFQRTPFVVPNASLKKSLLYCCTLT